ncbi:hypothetical protein L1049_015990 [Liquidambar formosana]|uniref:Expp1 protein n=1 Tax=Liquidambar formosana TaxID=63359 RepID=A0AAP0S4Y8_LIQFO
MKTTTMSTRLMVVMIMNMIFAYVSNSNHVFDPCSDAKIQKSDGFTFGLAFSTKESFFFNHTQLSPCDSRLPLVSKGAQLAVFRPKVDEISLLTIKSRSFNLGMSGAHMVAFAGRKYAARSIPVFVADNIHTIMNHTLVLEFQKGTLQNLFWKSFGCDSCSGHSPFVCVDKNCAISTSKCNSHGGSLDCSLGIQLTFSGTDKNNRVLNSWYEVKNLRMHSLYGLYSNLRDSLPGQRDHVF